jgi:endoplasmic reticulum-Golgi intermediate compartment protein 3
MGKGRFRAFDAFQKTVEEARIKTASGGLVTLVSACIIFWLVILEVWDWRRVVIRNELIVDKTRGTGSSSQCFECFKYNVDNR